MTKPLIALLVLPATLAYAGVNAPDAPAASVQQSIKKQQDSLDLQRASLHRQLSGKASDPAAEPAAFFIDPLPALPQANCDRLDKLSVDSLIAAAAKKQSLEPALLRAVMKQESGFKPCAVSIRGAQGLMQLMPATAGFLHVEDPFDPEQNVQAGAAFLKQLLGRYKGDLRLALVAYNAGTVRADQPPNAPYPAETQNYLTSIFAQLGMSQAPTLPDLEPLSDSVLAIGEAEPAAAVSETEPDQPKPTDTAPDQNNDKEKDKQAPGEKPAKP